MMQKFISKLKGIGLLELMLSLAIIAILLVMATRYFGMASKAQKIDDTIQLIGELESGVNTYITAAGETRANATLFALVNNDYLSPGRILGGKDACKSASECPLKSIWGDATTYVTDKVCTITFAKVPADACADLGKRFYGVALSTPGCDKDSNFTYDIK